MGEDQKTKKKTSEASKFWAIFLATLVTSGGVTSGISVGVSKNAKEDAVAQAMAQAALVDEAVAAHLNQNVAPLLKTLAEDIAVLDEDLSACESRMRENEILVDVLLKLAQNQIGARSLKRTIEREEKRAPPPPKPKRPPIIMEALDAPEYEPQAQRMLE